MGEKIRISYEELGSSKVDEAIAVTSAYDRAAGARVAAPQARENLIYKGWFTLTIAGLVGGFLAWCIIEPYFDDKAEGFQLMSFLFMAVTGCLVGALIGCIEGMLARNFRRSLKGAMIGCAIGFSGGIVSMIAANIIFSIVAIAGIKATGDANPSTSFGTFFFLVIARGLGWMVAGMTVGLGPGIALKSQKLAFNGFVGGMLGGLIGGLLFDPVNYLMSGGTFDSGAEVSRAIGTTAVGMMAGLMIGLVETLTKNAWLLMTQGPLAGKQFIIYRNPTAIGSSPQSEIYIFNDPEVEPRHATLSLARDGYILEDQNTASGTWVNGERVRARRLINGDRVSAGKAQFVYVERERKTSRSGA